MKNFICVVIDLETQHCIGVDFFNTEEKLRRMSDRYRKDSPNCVVMEYPPRELGYIKSVIDLNKAIDNILY